MKPTLFLKTTVVTLLLVFIITRLDLHLLIFHLSSTHLPTLLYVILLYPLSILISSLKWHQLTRALHLHLPLFLLFSLYWTGTFFSTFLPTDIGGDSYKLLFLNKHHPHHKKVILTSLILERLIGLCTAFCVAIIFFFPFYPLTSISLSPLPFLLIVLVLPILIFIFRQPLTTFAHSLHSHLPNFSQLIKSPALPLSFFLSLIFVLVSATSNYLAFQAFHHPLPFFTFLFVVPLSNLTGLLPFSLKFFGLKEGLAIYLYSLLQVPLEVSLSVLLTLNTLAILLNSLGIFFYLSLQLKPHSPSPTN